jgi:hypothetical protein
MTALSTWTFFLGGNVLILDLAVNSQEALEERGFSLETDMFSIVRCMSLYYFMHYCSKF